MIVSEKMSMMSRKKLLLIVLTPNIHDIELPSSWVLNQLTVVAQQRIRILPVRPTAVLQGVQQCRFPCEFAPYDLDLDLSVAEEPFLDL